MMYRITKTWTARKEWNIEADNYEDAQKLINQPDFEERYWDDEYDESGEEWTIEEIG